MKENIVELINDFLSRSVLDHSADGAKQNRTFSLFRGMVNNKEIFLDLMYDLNGKIVWVADYNLDAEQKKEIPNSCALYMCSPNRVGEFLGTNPDYVFIEGILHWRNLDYIYKAFSQNPKTYFIILS